MKYVLVPPPVHIMNHRFKQPLMQTVEGKNPQPMIISMFTFVVDYICGSEAVGKGVEAARVINKLQSAFLDVEPGELVGVEDADYKVAMACIGSINWTAQFQPFCGQLLPLIEAWEDAAKQDETWKKNQTAELKTV